MIFISALHYFIQRGEHNFAAPKVAADLGHAPAAFVYPS